MSNTTATASAEGTEGMMLRPCFPCSYTTIFRVRLLGMAICLFLLLSSSLCPLFLTVTAHDINIFHFYFHSFSLLICGNCCWWLLSNKFHHSRMHGTQPPYTNNTKHTYNWINEICRIEFCWKILHAPTIRQSSISLEKKSRGSTMCLCLVWCAAHQLCCSSSFRYIVYVVVC